ncbi:MAG: hypothetical protein K2P78_14185 [Gemmataceae bacterium]|nr:hypothetical protein [Gemmataceae bacterium]
MVRGALSWAVGGVWLAGAAVTFWAWERYETTPGAVAAASADVEPPSAGRWRLTVFLHPRCACNRATLGEVAEVAHAAPELAVRVVFVRPPGTPDGWERTELWDQATRIPGVGVAADPDGREAARSGAATSGYGVLTDPAGNVVFRGGMSRGRGRTGESAGRRAVLAWVRQNAGPAEVPAFGCELIGS